MKDDIVRHEGVQDIEFDYVDGVSESTKIFTVKTDKTIHYAKTVVLALGGNPPQAPPTDTPEAADAITHAMHIKEMPSARVRAKIAERRSTTNIVIVGGGLTSAQLSDLAARKGVTKIWLLMRGPLKVKPFDVGLEWVGKFRNFEQAAFWSSDADEERWQKILTARNGGSITPPYKKILQQQIAKGKVELLLHTTIVDKKWNAESKTWNVQLSTGKELPPIDHIYLATGVACTLEGVPCLQTLRSQYPVTTCGGLPCITDDMAWRHDVPLFITGRLAALQLGPGGGNLIGARTGAERVAWSIQDYLKAEGTELDNGREGDRFNFLTGRCGRYEALSESSDD